MKKMMFIPKRFSEDKEFYNPYNYKFNRKNDFY